MSEIQPDPAPFLGRWEQTADGRATLINLSENHTYRIDGPDGARHVLRLHRPGYQTAAAIRSELAWLAALGGAGLPLPRVLPGRDGSLVQTLGAGRHAVLFAFEEGREPQPGEDLVPLFHTLGRYAATLHLQAAAWTPPAGFERPRWSAEAVLDADGLWGDWRQGPNLDAAARAVLERLDRALREALAAYGTGRGRFGLIHADMRLANLLVAGDRVTLIDFDDCGYGWFMYDLGASLSFIDAGPASAALRRSWLDGYTRLRPLDAADIASIDAMILLRRMALLAWMGTHGETDLAREHEARFAADTAAIAEAWLV